MRFEELPAAGAAARGHEGSGTGGEEGGLHQQGEGRGRGVMGTGLRAAVRRAGTVSPENRRAVVSLVPLVVPRVTESGVSAGSRGWKTGGAGRWTMARSQKPRVPDTVFRIACVRVLSGAVKESSGSSRWDQHRETESRGAVSLSGQVIRASGVTARTHLDLRGTTLPLLDSQTTCPGRQAGSGCGNLPPARPSQTPNSKVHPFSTGFPAFLSSLQA